MAYFHLVKALSNLSTQAVSSISSVSLDVEEVGNDSSTPTRREIVIPNNYIATVYINSHRNGTLVHDVPLLNILAYYSIILGIVRKYLQRPHHR